MASIMHKVNKRFPFFLHSGKPPLNRYYANILYMQTERKNFKLYRKLESEKCNFSSSFLDSQFFSPELTAVSSFFSLSALSPSKYEIFEEHFASLTLGIEFLV